MRKEIWETEKKKVILLRIYIHIGVVGTVASHSS